MIYLLYEFSLVQNGYYMCEINKKNWSYGHMSLNLLFRVDCKID
uniref:Uncharacterized protein n=1 Tax=Rhizophora mucronata TaxID=61149 RepID=A0A2P2NTJ3_RHIMU